MARVRVTEHLAVFGELERLVGGLDVLALVFLVVTALPAGRAADA